MQWCTVQTKNRSVPVEYMYLSVMCVWVKDTITYVSFFKRHSSNKFPVHSSSCTSTYVPWHCSTPCTLKGYSWTVDSITYHESNNASATHQIWLRIGINKIWHTYIHSYIRTECKYNTQIKVPAVYVEYTHAHYIVHLCIHILRFCNPLIS